MFKKRKPKVFPPGTFIPTKARVCAIVQLSLAFMIILWNLSYPFMGELFAHKSQALLYHEVMGISSEKAMGTHLTRLEMNQQRFLALPGSEKQVILKQYHDLTKLSERTFIDKASRSIHILLFEIPFYEQLWLILSLILPIFVLKRIQGSSHAIWLLPLLTTVYALDNQFFGRPSQESTDSKLFPSEQVIISKYLKQPLNPDLVKQKEQLLLGWQLYLVNEWTNHGPSILPEELSHFAEDGEFAFNLARIQLLPSPQALTKTNLIQTKEPLPLLALYFFWNFFFALTAWRNRPEVEPNPTAS